MWIKQLYAAARGENLYIAPDYPAYFAMLSLNPEDNPSVSDINRAYRRAALVKHPDKGGDIDEFKKLQDAFKGLLLKLQEDQERMEYKTVRYEIELKKVSFGSGMLPISMALNGNAQDGAYLSLVLKIRYHRDNRRL